MVLQQVRSLTFRDSPRSDPPHHHYSFDHEGFSIWRVDFKYNEELTLTFMSSNQIGGFFNRLEESRKYLFGSVGVLGQSNASVISGAFILRGQDVKAVVGAAPDWESYSYVKLDVANAKDKEFFEAALAWDLEIDGKKWVDGKNVSSFVFLCNSLFILTCYFPITVQVI
jgi:elongation factor 1-gamma